MADEMRSGANVRDLTNHLLTAGYEMQHLQPEIRCDDDAAEFWFHYVDCRGGGYVYIGRVNHTYPTREAVISDWHASLTKYRY